MPQETDLSKTKVISVREAALIHGVEVGAIYIAIAKNRIKARKDPNSGRWEVNRESLEKYRCNKYSRNFSMRNGRLIFDKEQGLYSIAQTVDLLETNAQDIYYQIRKGELKASRSGAAYVLHIDDIAKLI